MPRRQGVVPPAQRQGDKPVAPADLWERLDAAVTAAGITFDIPEDAFTAKQYGVQKSITGEAARHRLEQLVRRGILVRGGTGLRHWYMFKEAK